MKYFDGNISELEREMIIKHNDKCSRCAEEFAVLREAIDTLEEFAEIEAPVGIHRDQVFVEIQSEVGDGP
jgi:anti-sigma factor RsiW